MGRPMLSARTRACVAIVAGLLLTLSAVAWVRSAPGSYVGSAQMVFIRPTQIWVPNPLNTGVGYDLIEFAAVVQREVNGGPNAPGVVGQDLTLANQGIRTGTLVRASNAGSQWADDFNRPMLDIQVVAPTEAGARARLDRAIHEVARALHSLQREVGVAPRNQVLARLAPATNRVAPADGDPRRALMGTLLLGGALTTVATRWVLRPRT